MWLQVRDDFSNISAKIFDRVEEEINGKFWYMIFSLVLILVTVDYLIHYIYFVVLFCFSFFNICCIYFIVG